jgi:hypothetical protein
VSRLAKPVVKELQPLLQRLAALQLLAPAR